MCKYEQIKQVTDTKNIVNVAVKEELDTKMWKHQNYKEIKKDLERIEKVKNMKNYFTSGELNDLLLVKHLMDLNIKISKEWLERGNLLEEEFSLINSGTSNIEKFLGSIISRMPLKEVEKFCKRTKRAQEDPIRIIDKWMQDRIFGTYETEYEIVKTERPKFEKLAFIAMGSNCRDGKRDFSNCDMYDILEDAMVPRHEIKKNCPYAFTSIEKLNDKSKKIKTESKRAKNKKANRFDEDKDDIEYNFIPKCSQRGNKNEDANNLKG